MSQLAFAGKPPRRARLIAVLALLPLLAFVAPAMAQEPLSTEQMRALSASAADRVVRQGLLSVLRPISRIDSGMFRTLRGVGMSTLPYGTSFHGVCRRDVVSLRYAPVDTTSRAEAWPVQPYGVEAWPLFHISSLPTTGPHGDWSTVIKRPECDRLGDDSTWFIAKDELEAVRGASLLSAAVDQVRAGALKSRTCGSLNDQTLTCEQTILAEGDLKKIDSVEACFATPGLTCFAINLDSSTLLTIVGHFEEDAVVPTRIESVAIEQYIIVT